MELRFIGNEKITLAGVYYSLKNSAKIYYNEGLDKPCLICHQSKKANTIVQWSHLVRPMVLSSLFTNGPDTRKKIEQSMIFSLISILIFWMIYSIIRSILYKRNKLDILAVSFLFEDQLIPKKFLRKIALRRSGFLYGESGNDVLRGYISKKFFLNWLDMLSGKKSKIRLQTFSGIKMGVMQVQQGYGFEGIRICQAITRKAEAGRVLFEYGILPSWKDYSVEQDTKKVTCRFRGNQLNRQVLAEEGKIYFIDFKFDSIHGRYKNGALPEEVVSYRK